MPLSNRKDACLEDIEVLQPTTAQQCRPETENNILEDLFSSVFSRLKKYHPSGNLECKNYILLNFIYKII